MKKVVGPASEFLKIVRPKIFQKKKREGDREYGRLIIGRRRTTTSGKWGT